jgi:hypothetical protein
MSAHITKKNKFEWEDGPKYGITEHTVIYNSISEILEIHIKHTAGDGSILPFDNLLISVEDFKRLCSLVNEALEMKGGCLWV